MLVHRHSYIVDKIFMEGMLHNDLHRVHYIVFVFSVLLPFSAAKKVLADLSHLCVRQKKLERLGNNNMVRNAVHILCRDEAKL